MRTFPCLAASVAVTQPAGDAAVTPFLQQRLSEPIGSLENACPARGGLASWQTRQLDRYVDENIGTRIRTVDLAASLGLSVSHFSRVFKKSSGISPRIYIIRRRIAAACAMMLASERSLTDVAHLNGFCDQSHFNRAFHSVIGSAPQAWRRGNRSITSMNDRAEITQKKKSRYAPAASLSPTSDNFQIESFMTC